MEVCRRSSWLLLLLGVSLLATTLQGVQGEVESEGPSESECRPYIEKALKELETGESTTTGDSKEDVPTVEVTTDDSEHLPGAGDDDTHEEGTESIESLEADPDAEQQDQPDTQEEESTEGAPTEQEEGTQEEVVGEEKSEETETGEESVEGDTKEDADTKEDTDDTKEDTDDTKEDTDDTKEETDDIKEETDDTKEDTDETKEEVDDTKEETDETKEETDDTKEVVDDTKEEADDTKEEADDTAEGADDTREEADDTKEEVDDTKEEVDDTKEDAGETNEEIDDTQEQSEDTGEDGETKEEAESLEAEAPVAEEDAQAETEEVKEEGETVQEETGESIEGEVESTEEQQAESLEAPTSQEDQDTAEGDTVENEADTKEDQDETKEEVKDETVEEPDDTGEDTKSDDTKSEATEDDKSDTKEDDTEEGGSAEPETTGGADEASAEKDDSAHDEAKPEQSEEDQAAEAGKDESEEAPAGVEEPVVEAESVEGETEEAESTERESAPEEELSLDVEIPSDLRAREHVEHLLKIDEEASEPEQIINRIAEITLRELKKLYENAIKPLEVLYKYRDLSNRHFGDAEIFSKPLILFMGPWSGGKSSIINYLLDNEYKETSLRTGAEPSPAYFNILMYGEEPEIWDGTQLAADFTFSGLQKFGQGLEERLRGVRLPSKLLEKVNIVEIPGILEVRKQVSRVFPFNDACQWFIDRADIIFLVYDPSKLDVGPETEAILDQLKGREHQTRIILNKADQVKPEELMRVQGALIWNISPLMSSAQPPVMYTTSLWSRPYESWAPSRLLHAQERSFLRDLRSAVDKRIENKIASARRFAVRVRNHAKMVDCYLTTYYNHKSVFGNRKQVADEIIEHPQDYHIYEGLSTLTNISRYDLPDPDVYKDFFKLNALYDFQQLSATCTYFRGCPINRLDVAIAYDLPEMVGKHKRLVESALAEANPAPVPGS